MANYKYEVIKPDKLFFRLDYLNKLNAIEFNNEKISTIGVNLRDDFIEEIKRSSYILDLDYEDWYLDFEGTAQPIKYELYKNTLKFLLKYYKYMDYYIITYPFDAPQINPCPNNTIDLSFDTNYGRMLVNVYEKNDKYFADYYAYIKGTEVDFKGTIDLDNFYMQFVYILNLMKNKSQQN